MITAAAEFSAADRPPRYLRVRNAISFLPRPTCCRWRCFRDRQTRFGPHASSCDEILSTGRFFFSPPLKLYRIKTDRFRSVERLICGHKTFTRTWPLGSAGERSSADVTRSSGESFDAVFISLRIQTWYLRVRSLYINTVAVSAHRALTTTLVPKSIYQS